MKLRWIWNLNANEVSFVWVVAFFEDFCYWILIIDHFWACLKCTGISFESSERLAWNLMEHSRQNDFRLKSYQFCVIPMENLSASNHITHTFDQYLQKFNFHSEFDGPYDFCSCFLCFRYLMLLIRKHKSPLLTCRVKANQSEHHESESLRVFFSCRLFLTFFAYRKSHSSKRSVPLFLFSW
jgi:hypothetical protein